MFDPQGKSGVMIKVSCPSCNASYDVDENRLPEDGLRMRCPKCSESFQVRRDGATKKAGAGAASATKKPPKRKPTQVGLGPISAPKPPPAPGPKGAAAQQPPTPVQDIDLPVPASGDGFADLPAPSKGSRSLDFDPFDDDAGADLPAPKESSQARFDPFGDVDLPAPIEGPGGTDLPAPLPGHGAADADLPTPMRGGQARALDQAQEEVDLPMALTDAELPKPKPASRVPDPISLDSELPMASEDRDLPVARHDFADLDLDSPAPPAAEGGPIELDLPDGDDLDLDVDLDAPAGVQAPPPPLGQAIGAPAVGQSEQGLGRDAAELEQSAGDGVHRMRRPSGARPEVSTTPDRPKKRAIKRPPWLLKAGIALGLVGLVVGAGFYAGTTPVGLFGVHLIEPFLPASGDEVLVTQATEAAELIAAEDTYTATRKALAQLAAAREEASLNRSLIARSLLHESYYQIRFGQDARSGEVADSLRLFLKRRGDEAPRVHVALAADALRNGDIASATKEIGRAMQADPSDSYVDLVAGELALRKRQGRQALDAFQRAMQRHESARARWGVSRAHRLLGQHDEAVSAADETLKASPNHAAARVAVAEHLLANGQIDEAAELVRAPAGLVPVDGTTLEVARSDRSNALALIARIEEQRGRLGAAREMYEKAIELDTRNTDAALGAARLVLLEGAYPDALARFQTVLGSEVPVGAVVDATGKPSVVVAAKLGAAEALLAMDKPEDARQVLADLETPEPANPKVEVWLGNVAAAVGDTKSAVRHLRNAIALEPHSIGAYVALATHYADTRRPDEAVAVLVEAQNNVDITAEVRRLLGIAELQRGRLDAAIEQLREALEMEPRDSASAYGLAEAYRRKRMFEEAEAALDKVEELDSKFPGLQLERGRLAEARGDMKGAIEDYRAAIAEDPNDAALKSRLGAALVLTGDLAEAEKLLHEVLRSQPYLAEAEHFLGRIALRRGQIEAARLRFQRASQLDPTNGTYRMYVGWAALESGEMTPALRELDAALKLDPNLGDAYWLRARIRIRAGVVRDALSDLKRALELNPSRIEAWAAMGECHFQLGQVKEAVRDFEKAVQGNPENAYWWYRLGRLQLDEGLRGEAASSLSKATALGDDAPDKHGWLADAHRLIGDIYYAQRKRQDAVVEYGRYLELAEADAIDRRDVELKLRKISKGY